jgi:hypothetical protein
MESEIGIGNFRFYMDLEILDEFFKNDRGPGGVPIAVGADVVSNAFDFLPVPEV